MLNPPPSQSGGQWRRGGGVRWLVGENSHGELQIHPHKSPTAPDPNSITSGEAWRLFGVGHGSTLPAMGSSGKTEIGTDGRQPAALAAMAVAGRFLLKPSIGVWIVTAKVKHRWGNEDLLVNCCRWVAVPACGRPACSGDSRARSSLVLPSPLSSNPSGGSLSLPISRRRPI